MLSRFKILNFIFFYLHLDKFNFRNSQKMNGHVGNEHWATNSSPRSKMNSKYNGKFVGTI